MARLRRLALAAQGLLKARHFGVGLDGAKNAIGHLGYIQIDTISVVERAHNHVVHTRVPQFSPHMINEMLLARDVFEYWSHAAAFLPIADFRFSLPYKHAIKNGEVRWYKNPDRKLMQEVLARIRLDGPLRSRDLEASSKPRGGWWDWKPAKKALEQLYMQGELMVSARDGFQKRYDLSERVLPADIDTLMPSDDEYAEHIIDQQLRCHGVVSLRGFTYLRKLPGLRKAVQMKITERVAQQELQQIRLPDGGVFFCEPGALEAPLPRLSKRMQILSPFDNSVIQRDRLKALFGYDFQLECYVPEAKRQFGYFCLPLLYRGVFVGRMDCKVHRPISQLEVKAVYFEQTKVDGVKIDEGELTAAFVGALQQFCAFQKCDSIVLRKVAPKRLEKHIKSALKVLW